MSFTLVIAAAFGYLLALFALAAWADRRAAAGRSVIGNAGFPNDGSYAKLEIMPQEGGGWRFLNKLDVGVKDGSLGTLDSAYLAPGAYFLRLLIVDKDGHEIKICRLSLRVQ